MDNSKMTLNQSIEKKKLEKALMECDRKIKEMNDELNKHYSDEKINQQLKAFSSRGDSYVRNLKNQLERERESIIGQIKYTSRIRENIIKQAKDKGISLS